MKPWLLVAPERPDDTSLPAASRIARETAARAPLGPTVLAGRGAVRAAFEGLLDATPGLAGLAFFGHGADDRLYDADRPPEGKGPALLDRENVSRLRGFWIHAFACWSGNALATHAVESGAEIYVGYKRPLDAVTEVPADVVEAFLALVTTTTLALVQGERDERALRGRASLAADDLYLVLETLPDDTPGLIWLYPLAEALVDDMIVARS